MNRFKLTKFIGRHREFFALSMLLFVCALTALFTDSLLEVAGMGSVAMAAAPVVVKNRGRLINFIAGINGVTAGGQALATLDVNKRYHRITLFTTESGSASAVGDVITSIKVLVNGIAIRDITPAQILRTAQALGYLPKKGELPIFFSEPFTMNGPNVLEPSDMLSWDLFGQATFALQIGIDSGATSPGITGVYEFDYERNLRPNGQGGVEPYLQPVAIHAYTQALVTGLNVINTIPFNYPIRRMWFLGSSAGNITQLEITQDSNKVLEGTDDQLKAMYAAYGFKFSQEDLIAFQNATGPANLALDADFEALSYYDAAAIFDPDGRWWKALKIGQSLELRVTSGANQNLTTVVEYMPGAYAS